jgi:short-subunit dehydrogenase
LLEQGEGHVVNTASVAGLKALPFMSPYTATKHAVVGLSEALAFELAMSGSAVHVSVLCPGFIRTRIHESERNWPPELGDPPNAAASPVGDLVRNLVEGGMEPSELAERVVAAIRTERFFILSDDAHAGVPGQRAGEAASGGQPTLPDLGLSE